MSTNLLPFNPSNFNAETDAQYNADPIRVGGYPVNSPIPSALLNKTLTQQNIGPALAQAMANKGYTVNDYPYAALVSVLGNLVTTADLYNGGTTLAYAANLSIVASIYSYFDVTLTGPNCNMVISSARNFQQLWFIIRQDSTGGRTATINIYGIGPQASSNYSIPLSTEPNAVNIFSALVGGDGSCFLATPIQVI